MVLGQSDGIGWARQTLTADMLFVREDVFPFVLSSYDALSSETLTSWVGQQGLGSPADSAYTREDLWILGGMSSPRTMPTCMTAPVQSGIGTSCRGGGRLPGLRSVLPFCVSGACRVINSSTVRSSAWRRKRRKKCSSSGSMLAWWFGSPWRSYW